MKIHTVQLNLEDFENGTSDMSLLEFAIYTRLFLASYTRNIPDDDEKLSRIARCKISEIKKVRQMIDTKFTKFEGFLKNLRVEVEREKYKKLSETNRKVRLEALERQKEALRIVNESSNNSSANRTTNDQLTNNQHQPPNNQNGFKTPTPFVRTHTAREGKEFKAIGDLVGGVGEKRFLKVLDVTGQLQHADILEVQKAAPKWDIEALAKVYVDGINSGSRDAPRSIPKAFPKWCAAYTGGKEPS